MVRSLESLHEEYTAKNPNSRAQWERGKATMPAGVIKGAYMRSPLPFLRRSRRWLSPHRPRRQCRRRFRFAPLGDDPGTFPPRRGGRRAARGRARLRSRQPDRSRGRDFGRTRLSLPLHRKGAFHQLRHRIIASRRPAGPRQDGQAGRSPSSRARTTAATTAWNTA